MSYKETQKIAEKMNDLLKKWEKNTENELEKMTDRQRSGKTGIQTDELLNLLIFTNENYQAVMENIQSAVALEEILEERRQKKEMANKDKII